VQLEAISAAGEMSRDSLGKDLLRLTFADDKDVVFPRATWGESSWPTALREKRIVCVNELSKLTPPGHIPVQRNLAVPLIYRGKVVGLFQMANKETDYDEVDLALAETLAGAIAPILDARFKAEREEEAKAQAQADLRELAADLRRSNEELEQFAYVASHDLQEPLRMVASFTQLLEEKVGKELDQDALDFMGFVMDGANRMQALINDLLEFSRGSSKGQPPEPVGSNVAMGRAVSSLIRTMEESGAVVTNDELPPVMADASQLERLFLNLLGNAIKFRGAETPRVHVSADRVGDDWQFSVSDNGIGISQEYSERVFHIFQRLHSREAYEGTGIGLAVCKRIVERHGGRIWLESEPGRGARFQFTIPISDGGTKKDDGKKAHLAH
jgi:light-regulated signal transduction histidine kinase (bacteriophytochrome)